MKTIVAVAVPVLAFGLLVTVGCDLRARDFRRLFNHSGILLTGLVLPVLTLPALALALLAIFQPPANVGTGLLLVAACPIGGLSNLYSYLARASVPLSVALTGLSCVLAVLTIPTLGAGFERALGKEVELAAPLPLLAVQVFLLLALPIALGMWIGARQPHAVERYRSALRRTSVAGLGVLLVFIVLADPGRFFSELPATLPLSSAFVLASFGVGWTTGLLIRTDRSDRFTLAAEFATRNVAVASTLAVTLLHRVEFATFATAYVLVEIPMLLLAATAFRARSALVRAVS